MEYAPELSVRNALGCPIKETDGYGIWSGEAGKRVLILGDLNEKLVSDIAKEGIGNIEMIWAWARIKSDVDLSHLGKIPNLASLTIDAGVPIDWRPVQQLRSLRRLRLKTSLQQPQPIDFTQFKHLEHCTLSWHPEWESVFKVKTLKGLGIEDTHLLAEVDVRHLAEIREILVRRCNGLRRILCAKGQRIVSLGVTSCKSLESVTPVEVLKHLEYLVISGRSKLAWETFGNCRAIQRLWLEGVGPVPTLRHFSKNLDLQSLCLLHSTDIQDGDLSVLLDFKNLESLIFKNRKHYSHKRSDFKNNQL